MSNRVTVTVTDARGGNDGTLDSARWFVAGLTQRGSTTTYTRIRSLGEYQAKLGDRVTYGLLYDCADAFFHEGGSEIVVGRVVGPAAAQAAHTFTDGSNPALTVKANSVGDWGNNLTVQITAGGGGGTFVLTVRYNGTVVETSPDLADATAAINWAAANSSYVVVTDPGAVADPAVVAATALSGGTDDRNNVVTASWSAALGRLPKSLGCAQVSAPGATATAVQQAVADHADANNRVALLDSTPGASAATVVAQGTALTGNGRKRASILAPWATIPGLTTNTTRSVPYSAIQAGMTARSDKSGGSVPAVDKAVAAANGTSSYAIGLETTWTDTDQATLDAGRIVPAIVGADGTVQTYGDRTLADPLAEPQWFQTQMARTTMYIADEGSKVGARYVFATLDPALVTVGSFKGELKAILASLYPAQNAADPATGATASQDTTTRTLSGSLKARPNPSAEAVAIDVIVEVN